MSKNTAKTSIRKVEVLPFNPEWKKKFEREALRLKQIFGDVSVDIHHIGSTSIPGMRAKPVIDILIEVKDINDVENLNMEMAKIGYEAKGENGMPARRYFRKEENGIRSHHVHVFQTGNPEIKKHIAFRDYLRSHPDVATEYKQLKEDLAKKYPEDIESYVQGKNDFIKRVDEKTSHEN